MKVYVVERGDYEDRCVVDIYATAEAAMEAFPPAPRPEPRPTTHSRVYDSATGLTRDVEHAPYQSRLSYAWEQNDWGWSLDDGSSTTITEYEVQT